VEYLELFVLRDLDYMLKANGSLQEKKYILFREIFKPTMLLFLQPHHKVRFSKRTTLL